MTPENNAAALEGERGAENKRKSTPMNPRLDAALRYAALGYGVFPLRSQSKVPMTAHGLLDASTDPDQIAAWWAECLQANIGLSTTRLVVIDEDEPWLTGNPDRELSVAGAPTARTPRGGTHRIFRAPPGSHYRNTDSVLSPDVDTRATGGYIVVAPSYVKEPKKKIDGSYVWAPGLELDVPPERLPLPPDWLRALLDGMEANRGKNGAAPDRSECSSAGATGEKVTEGNRHKFLVSLAGSMRNRGMCAEAIAAALRVENERRCAPPKNDAAIAKIAASVERYEPAEEPSEPPEFDASDLCERFPTMREPVVHGLLRHGETMNVVAASKSNKSWLITDLVIAVAMGLPWMGFGTVQGRVLLIDNELHPNTIADRLRRVATARGVAMNDLRGRLLIRPMRGRLVDIFELAPVIRSYSRGEYRLVAMDAWYRFLPASENAENSNGTIAQTYNALDRYALGLDAAFSVVHHASKGSQSGKATIDVGAGAGAQSRAADTHLILRPHKEDGAAVVEAALRSWAPVEPMALRWQFPVWEPAPDLDPADLREYGSRRKKNPDAPDWDVEPFVQRFVTDQPKTMQSILAEALHAGVPERKAKRMLKQAEEGQMIHRSGGLGRKPLTYSTAPVGDVE